MAFKKILVAIRDVERSHRTTLEKVAALLHGGAQSGARTASGTRRGGSRIELFHSISDALPAKVLQRGRQTGTDPAEAIAERYREKLVKLQRSGPLASLGSRVSVHAQWDFPPHEAIIRRALATGADLVVAETHPHRFGSRLFLANTDWELIRNCPCPVLLTKPRGSYERPAIIAAVDPFHANKPAGLESGLIKAGQEVARQLRGELHLFHAYSPITVLMPFPAAQGTSMWLPPEVEQQHERDVKRGFERLAREAQVTPARRHLRLGEVPSQLRDVVKRTHAQIVVMGAVSRSALERFIIGSTAERVLDGLDSDALIIKPRGFRASVRKSPYAVHASPNVPARRGSRAASPVSRAHASHS